LTTRQVSIYWSIGEHVTDTAIRDQILDAAEARARAGGYYGFSFRDVAEDVGIKSASVHYHFPTKADLAEALVRRYAARARERLGDPANVTPEQAVQRTAGLFRDALKKEDRMCLCGLFGAERDALPPNVAAATAEFFRLILDYLATSFGPRWKGEPPASVLARMEGALIVARSLKKPELFETAIRGS
jgi:TetR/AcrR family transcriptional repressor of nem operon